MRNYLFGVKKWLELNGVDVAWKKIEFPTSTETKEVDAAPTKEVLIKLLDHCSSTRDCAVIEIASSSGLRIGTLLSLTVGDVNFNYQDLARINVGRKLGRKFVGKRQSQGRFYSTFMTPEAKAMLLEYLKERRMSGEEITESSPLVADA